MAHLDPTIHRLRALKDNYVYLLVDGDEATAIDPGEARPVDEALAAHHLRLVWILNTHHHADHSGANEELARRHGAHVIGPASDAGRIPGQTRRVVDGERLELGGLVLEAMHVPAHTTGHTAYRLGRHLFSGDTLFGGGCGRLFEGTPADMVRALTRLRALPDDTLLECGHEYTLHNLRFAVTIDPDNEELRARHAELEADPARWTVPIPLDVEKRTNPFLRWDTPALRSWSGVEDPVETFARLRRAKDVWRG